MEYIVILALSLFDKPDLQFYNYRFMYLVGVQKSGMNI